MAVKMSPACENFIGAVIRQDWTGAFHTLNSLNMYEMLRAMAALDRLDLTDLWAQRGQFTNQVYLPRIEYAYDVVTNRLTNNPRMTLPATAPGDLQATGQVVDAQNFIRDPSPLRLTRDLTGQIGVVGSRPGALAEADFVAAAAATGVEVAAIMAVAQNESMGRPGFSADGRPVVRYELHIFSKLTRNAYDHTHPHLSRPKPVVKGKPFHDGSSAHEWSMIYGAMILRDGGGNRRTSEAWQAASWGKFQVMGMNAVSDGWGTVNNFVYSMFQSEAKHLEAYFAYCRRVNIIRHLKSHNWLDFAIGYNGGGQADNHYDTRLDTAFNRISADRKARGLTP